MKKNSYSIDFFNNNDYNTTNNNNDHNNNNISMHQNKNIKHFYIFIAVSVKK